MQKRRKLEERLGCSSPGDFGCPAAGWLYLTTYFEALEEMGILREEQGLRPDMPDTFIAHAAAMALSGDMPQEEADALLYAVLIRPFAGWEL